MNAGSTVASFDFLIYLVMFPKTALKKNYAFIYWAPVHRVQQLYEIYFLFSRNRHNTQGKMIC